MIQKTASFLEMADFPDYRPSLHRVFNRLAEATGYFDSQP
jgi:hypothetical protein